MGKTKIAVIGAGIIGSAIAVELIASGFDVEVLSGEPHADTATPKSFGWINAHGPENRHHFKMRLESMRLWRMLKTAHPALPARAITALDYDLPKSNIDRIQTLYGELGHTTHLAGETELAKQFPNLSLPRANAIVSRSDMVADPAKIGKFFRSYAQKLGAVFSDSILAETISASANAVTITSDSQTRTFDHVVIAAGTGSQRLVEQLGFGLPMKNSGGILLKSTPQEHRLAPLISAPDLHCWQMSDGRMLAGSTQAGSDPNSDTDALKQRIARKLKDLSEEFHGIEFPEISIGTRPEPIDGMPVIDVVNDQQNIHLAVMHSGITLAPFVAKAVAHQIKTGAQHETTEPYSLSRFQNIPERLAV